MARPDLVAGYGGWQVVDSTPQERSNGKYRLGQFSLSKSCLKTLAVMSGPAPVLAVRRGEVGLGYDTEFVFAEVNADVAVWVEDVAAAGGWRKLHTDTERVGKLVVTLARPGTPRAWEDLTPRYKGKEGGAGERLAVARASGGTVLPGLTCRLLEAGEARYGEEYRVSVEVKLSTGRARQLSVLLASQAVSPTGVAGSLVSRATGTFTLQPGQRDTLTVSNLHTYMCISFYTSLSAAGGEAGGVRGAAGGRLQADELRTGGLTCTLLFVVVERF